MLTGSLAKNRNLTNLRESQIADKVYKIFVITQIYKNIEKLFDVCSNFNAYSTICFAEETL